METAIYIRVSTDEQAQEGFSLRAQEQKLKDYARIKDWSIYKIYMDDGISGKNITDRPDMQALIEDVKKGAVKNVLVYKTDRLTRRMADLLYLIELFDEHNCAYNSLTESIDTQTPSGRMFLKIIGIFAEFERENIVERTKAGFERKIKEGYSLCCRIASYGYDRPNGQKIQTVNEQEAAIVREIFDMFVKDGISMNDIARRLNFRKVPTKLGESTWSSDRVRQVITNSNLIGQVRHHTKTAKYYAVDGLHEPIISHELFETAQNLLVKKKRTTPTKRPRPDNYFSGFLVCGLCGSKLLTHNQYNTLKDGSLSVTSSYRCEKRRVHACTACNMSRQLVESAFSEYIGRVRTFDVSDELEIETQKKTQDLELIKTYREKQRKLEIRERETLDLYVESEIGFEEYREIKKRIDREKATIYEELARLEVSEDEPKISKADIVERLYENWQKLSNSARHTFLHQFVDKIAIVREGKGARIIGIDFKAC